MARTHDGGLVVGTTRRPDLDFFTADGAKVRTIDTGWKALPVTARYRDRYRALAREQAEAAGRKAPPQPFPLPDVLEILQDVWTDDQGNVLVVRKTDCLDDCPLETKVYSPDGVFLCECEFLLGPFVLTADNRFKRLVVSSRGIYGLIEFKDDPDGFLHLFRMVFPPWKNDLAGMVPSGPL
jgi:hypothetical protein